MKTQRFLTVCFFLIACTLDNSAWAQTAPSLSWQKCLGGTSYDYGKSICSTTDGGYITSGYSFSNDDDVSGNHGSTDYWVVKLSASGNIEWQKCLGGSDSETANSIRQTLDGGFVVAGYTYSNDGDVSGNHGSYDYWIVKLDASHNIEWQKCLGGSQDDYAYSVLQTTDVGYLVTGYSYSNDGDVSGNHGDRDYWIVKLDASGNMEWQKSLGGGGPDLAYSSQQATDGGFILAGSSYSEDGDVSGNHGNMDCWIVKLDASGNIEWQKCLGGSSDEAAHSIQQTSEGGLIVAGFTYSNDGDVSGNNGASDYWVVKLDISGNIEWQKCLGGSLWELAYSIALTTDGGFIASGSSSSYDGDVSGNHGDDDYWIIKLDDAGDLKWQKCLGGSLEDIAYSVHSAPDEGYIIAGVSNSNNGDVSGHHNPGNSADYWIVKLSCNGIVLYADADADGYGNPNDTIIGNCNTPPAGYVSDSTDCDDNNSGIHPGADEILNNSIDDNCDGLIQEVYGPAIQWQKCLGGSEDDYANSIQQTSDSGFIVAGSTSSTDGNVSGNHGSSDYWVVKLDASHNIEWQKCLGGSQGDYANFIQQTTDGGFMVAGYTSSNDGDVSGNHGSSDYWIVKLDGAGSIEWQKCLGGTQGDYAFSIQQTTDSGFIVAGYTSSNDSDVSGNHGGKDYWLVKLDYSGSIEWQKCLGGSGSEEAYSVQQSSDGGFIVAGYIYSTIDEWDYWIVKIDSAGNIEWEKNLGGNSEEIAYSVQQSSDGGFIVAGHTFSYNGDVSGNHGGGDYWVVKLDASGNMEWQKCLGGDNSDYASSIRQTTDGGFVLAGSAESNNEDVYGNHGGEDYWIVKLNAPGNMEWQKCLGGSASEAASSIQQTFDGGFIIAGESNSSDGDVTGNHGGNDYWLVQLSCINQVFYADTDGDLYGTLNDTIVATICYAPPAGYVADNTDCNDGDSNIHPGAAEICDGIDNNCDGNIDEGVLLTFYADVDGDSYGDANNSTLACSLPGGYVTDYADCDDSNIIVHPGALEICNTIDDNCDGSIDEGLLLTFYADTDGDTYGNAGNSTLACSLPYGYVADNTDCDDSNALVYPGASEICNDIDDNCINGIDEGLVFINYYQDADTDSYGNPLVSDSACNGAPIGFVTDSTDCNDNNANVYPGAQEITNNGVDDNCNAVIDEFGVGINEASLSFTFSIIPNPAEDYATIQFTLPHSSHVHIKVYDVTGKEIETLLDAELQQGRHSLQLNTNQFSKGVYNVRMVADFGTVNQKLIVQ